VNTDQKIDVAVIGGGAAGLSAAVTLARSLRSVAVVQPPLAHPAGHVARMLTGADADDPTEHARRRACVVRAAERLALSGR
jgi:succinate dehydrogenase/fumarate reductase flavoprotein subunit